MKINTLIIAHRGESYGAPENTLASINLAWERGAEAVEIEINEESNFYFGFFMSHIHLTTKKFIKI